jgi:hypothetical protein
VCGTEAMNPASNFASKMMARSLGHKARSRLPTPMREVKSQSSAFGGVKSSMLRQAGGALELLRVACPDGWGQVAMRVQRWHRSA